jgi:hypothetical protein
MRGFVFVVLCAAGFASQAVGQEPMYTTRTSYSENSSAQGVAEMQARSGRCQHFGGNRGYEGVGYSSSSSDAAVRNCCYWGQRKPREIGVAKGPRGWFACVRYH